MKPALKRHAFVFLLILAGISSSLFALEIPKKPLGYVSDYAGMLSPSTRQQLETQLAQFEKETSNQVIVVTFPSLDGRVLEDFSIRLAHAWKVGQKGKDNGVILLIFKDDRKMRIEVGYGLEGVLPDAEAKAIIEEEIKPSFQKGKFDEGVQKGIAAIVGATKGEYKSKEAFVDEPPMVVLLLISLFLIIFLTFNPLFMVLQFACFGLAIHFASLPLAVLSIIFWVMGILLAMSGGIYLGPSVGRWGSWDSGGGGGGFSGGGGSFGGGGASGGW